MPPPFKDMTCPLTCAAWGQNARLVSDGNVTNLGIEDQRMSLIWVRDNIRNFGGNPNLVRSVAPGDPVHPSWSNSHAHGAAWPPRNPLR